MSRVWPVNTFHKNIFLLDEHFPNCKLLVSIKLGNFELWRRFAKSFFKRRHLSCVACDTFPHEDRDKRRYLIGRVSNGESGAKRFLKMEPSCDWPIRRKGCSSDVSSRSFGGALRDIQKTAARETRGKRTLVEREVGLAAMLGIVINTVDESGHIWD